MDLPPVNLEQLRALPAFANTDLEEFGQVEPGLRMLAPLRGETIILEKDPVDGVYFVLDGECQISRTPLPPKPGLIALVGSGEQFGAAAVMFRSSMWDISVTAETEARLIWMAAPQYRLLLDLSQSFRDHQLRKVAQNCIGLAQRSGDIATLGVNRRLRALLHRLAVSEGLPTDHGLMIAHAPTHRRLADLIGCRAEVVTRELQSLAEQGVLSRRRGEIIIIDLGALAPPAAPHGPTEDAVGSAARTEHLQALPAFHHLAPEALQLARDGSSLVSLEAGGTIASAGARLEHVYFVVSGACRLTIHSGSDRPALIARLVAGQQFGELAVMAGLDTWPASVVAEETTVVLRLDLAAYRALLNVSAAFRQSQIATLGETAYLLGERTSELAVLDMSRRLRGVLRRLASLHSADDGAALSIRPAPSHARLAEMVGARREVITRELRALQRDGVLELAREHIIIRQPERL